MKTKFRCLVTYAALTVSLAGLNGCNSHSSNTYNEPSLPGDSYIGETFHIEAAEIKYEPALDAYLFSLQTKADVASIRPTPIGQVNGAPVLGYVFVTSLLPADIGFTVANLAIVLAYPLLLQGLSVVHTAMASYGAWTIGYVAFYVVMIFFGWLSLAVVALGMAEPVLKLRERLMRPKST